MYFFIIYMTEKIRNTLIIRQTAPGTVSPDSNELMPTPINTMPERRSNSRRTDNTAKKYCLDFLYRKYMKDDKIETPIIRQSAPGTAYPDSNDAMPTPIATMHAIKKRRVNNSFMLWRIILLMHV